MPPGSTEAGVVTSRRAGHLAGWLAAGMLFIGAAQRPAIGGAVTWLPVRDLQGVERSLKDYAGPKGLVVFFWASWSERSVEELGRLDAARKEIGDHGVGLVAVNVERESSPSSLGVVKQKVSSLNISIPVVVDDGLKVFNAYGVVSVPSTAVVNEKGELVYFLAGYSHEMREELFDKIDQLAGIEHARPAAPVSRANPAAIRRLQMARVQLAGGRVAAARSSFEAAAEADPAFADPVAELAALALDDGDATAAKVLLDKALALDKTSVCARLELGRLQLVQGQAAEARKTLAELVGDDPLIQAYLGFALLVDGQPEAARAAFEKLGATAAFAVTPDLSTLTALTPAEAAVRMAAIRRIVVAKKR
jgi:tetratricopeptide (TPR) repeat protein